MAEHKIVNTTQLEADLTLIADALRAKLRTSNSFSFPDSFVSGIRSIGTNGEPNEKYIIDTTTEPARNLPGLTGENWTITTWSDGSREAELIMSLKLQYWDHNDNATPPTYDYGTYDSFPYVVRLLPAGFSTSDDVEVAFESSSDGRTVTPGFSMESEYNVISFYHAHSVVSSFAPDNEDELTVTLKIKLTSTDNFVVNGDTIGNDFDKYFEGSITEVSLQSANAIRENSFYNHRWLTKISMPNVKEIRYGGFYDCSNLELTELPSELTSLAICAFSGCAKLAITELPSSLTYIDHQAFNWCSGLTFLTFKSKPQFLSMAAFQNCENLTTINVPWAEGELPDAPWGATNATINYNYAG